MTWKISTLPFLWSDADALQPSATISGPMTAGDREFGEDAVSRYQDRYQEEETVDRFIEEVKALAYTVALRAEEVWMEVQNEFAASLPVPLVALGEHGGVMFTWERGEHYVEIEVLEGRYELFYSNTAGHDVPVAEDVTFDPVQAATAWLSRVAAAE